ncbi:MAG: hypothetical protein A2487_16870 [Candidatus Raymondbacteria bacterium RifOxyC12_full_50_8]|uniref:DUF1232 domain-containing protein n=1 Tax=Candidatus Raymondbacteria bacterium RIFOXYD12_FULL_49_13 TaxID=1817890 RepID=A0A1F7F0C9_UNCRA|nr:MAG: hypothetical protein A2248_21745 [Candidatus Raymondbacteria bacterium RIFOXYA2_FULL_49_16]OGK00062.1 MAG: hypothetical protein A2519_22300 [Candidatus Raymondbacteria bacterium RIFOXYD12_FULL_49_13]OGK01352.1 MAG: hypothetical protein A2487_16870 [Candidatus Raymondbacteria bacterium RifOxyC12_full_50_8]OGK03679.1 MAG: hypothetical protein A2350_12980 [Candidatus Raymondbacteria bacterium RifOxyB12_full_50_8]OGP45051.1 MAG: hypothetical protein A2324_13625 [Candidatus Raymondbacteria b
MEKDGAPLNEEQKKTLRQRFAEMTQNVNKEDVVRLLRIFEGKFKKVRDKLYHYPPFRVYVRQCELAYEAIRSWSHGEYELPWQIVGAMTAALLYVLNPLDLIPDFIPIIGFVDDIFIITLCIRLVRGELRDYCAAKGLNPKDYGL